MQQPNSFAYQDEYFLNSEQSPAGHLTYYADGAQEIIHVNSYIVNLFACDSVQDFLEYTQGTFRNFVCVEDRASVDKSIEEQIPCEGETGQVFYRIRTKAGDLVSIMGFGSLVAGSEDRRPVYEVIIARMAALNRTDWLTGMPSMTHFHDLARAGVRKLFAKGSRPVAVSLDIMGMKDFNARYGRSEGNRLLFDLATLLRTCFGNDACSRFAEDHFYAYAAENEVEEKLKAVFRGFSKADFAHVPPVRAGVYALHRSDDIVATGFDYAKLACDLDRTTWRSHITWFTGKMREAARRRMHVLESLDQAIASGWIRPHYQAIVRAATGEICNEEALARWMDPEFGKLYPDQFIPDLEEAGLLYKLDLHIVDCVVRDLCLRKKRGMPLVPISMNFSLRDLTKLDLARELARRADEAGIPRGLLRVELTESVASSDQAFMRKQLDELHAAGFEVWMDDFGSGYSSLNTLQEFDFDLIKLDMGFLRSNDVEKSHIIMAGVVEAANRLGVATLAEGVESEDQAVFLESIGCDMLQGFHYAKPRALDEILNHFAHYDDVRFERFDEKGYWNAISLLTVSDFITQQGNLKPEDVQQSDHNPMQEVPRGVVECRDGTWSMLRGNRAFKELLVEKGYLASSEAAMHATPLTRPLADRTVAAAQKSVVSGEWEHVVGQLEQSTSHQLFIRHVKSTPDAQAFMCAAVPTMLGSALGAYGDVPLAYAVFRTIMNEDGTKVVDTEYVYANNLYHAWSGFEPGELAGKSFLDTMANADSVWFPYCYRAVVQGEHVHDVVYSPEVNHWLSFYLAPTPIENCCVFAFAMVDDEKREQEQMAVGRETSDLIIRFADLMNSSMSYRTLMQQFLELLGEVVHSDRLYIYERGENSIVRTVEWCAPGIEAHASLQQEVPLAQCAAWDALLAKNEVALIPSIEDLQNTNPALYEALKDQEVKSVLAVPLYHSGELVGVVGTDNYRLDENLDIRRLLGSVAPFVSARMANHRLLNELEYRGTHDELTGMLNRHGVDLAIAERLAHSPQEPFALALMDIDDFKVQNDIYGHKVGDELLRLLSHVVSAAFPEDAVLGRNGGDEFVAMVQGPQSAHMEHFLARIMDANKTFELDGTQYEASLSVGYVDVPAQTESLRTAYSMADTALYTVKLTGKSGFRRYATEMEVQYRMRPGFTPADIANNVPGSIVVHLPGDGEILFANDELVDLFECESLTEFMELTGGTYGGMIHPDDRARVRDELATQMTIDDVGVKDFVNYRILTKKGNVIHTANNGRLIELEGIGKVFYELIINLEERGIR